MIRKALGLGLMILILKFLMKEVFSAAEGSLVQLFSTANVLFSNMGSMPSQNEIMRLVPH